MDIKEIVQGIYNGTINNVPDELLLDVGKVLSNDVTKQYTLDEIKNIINFTLSLEPDYAFGILSNVMINFKADAALILDVMNSREFRNYYVKVYEYIFEKSESYRAELCNVFKSGKQEPNKCEFCSKNTILMEKEIIDATFTGWGNETKISKLNYKDIVVMFDTRGYIRLVDKDDSNCLDHGQKFKVKFCPACGRELEVEK